MNDSKKPIDQSNVELIAHICIRDPDTGEIILRHRDVTPTENQDAR